MYVRPDRVCVLAFGRMDVHDSCVGLLEISKCVKSRQSCTRPQYKALQCRNMNAERESRNNSEKKVVLFRSCYVNGRDNTAVAEALKK